MRRVPLGNTHYFKFTTRNFSTGAPFTLAGTPVISIYEENNLTQITAGVTLTADYDSVTGLNNVAVVASSGNGYEVGKTYSAVITTGTVNSVSVVGEVVDQFVMVPAENTAGYPLVDVYSVGGTSQTANDNGADINAILVDTNSLNDTKIPQTLNLTALGNIGIDWANVENPTTAVDLAATDIQLVDTCTTNTDMRGTDNAATATALATAQTDLDTLTGTDGATLATSQPNYAPSVAGDAMTLTAAATSAQLVDDIWDEPIAGHLTAGTSGLSEALGSAALVDGAITGAPTATVFTFTGGNVNDNFYNDQLVYILSGTGIGQVRPILSSAYSGGTTTITVDESFIVTPAAADRFAILVSHVHPNTQISAQVMADIDANGSTVIDELTTQGDTNETKLDTLTTQVGTAGAGLTDLGGMSTGMKAEVNSEADTALSDYDPPTNAEMEARTPTAAQLAYIVSNAADGLPVTFTGGTTTTAILGNVDGAAASSIDDVYNGRILVFNAGTLDQQVTDITDYDGGTKTATITAVTTAVISGHTANMK